MSLKLLDTYSISHLLTPYLSCTSSCSAQSFIGNLSNSQVAQPGTPTATSLALQGFMLAAQQETWDPPLDGGTIGHDDEVDLKVFLMNDQQYNIRGRPTLQTEDILEVRHPF